MNTDQPWKVMGKRVVGQDTWMSHHLPPHCEEGGLFSPSAKHWRRENGIGPWPEDYADRRLPVQPEPTPEASRLTLHRATVHLTHHDEPQEDCPFCFHPCDCSDSHYCGYCQEHDTLLREARETLDWQEVDRQHRLETADCVLRSPVPFPGPTVNAARWTFYRAGLRHLIAASLLACVALPAFAAERHVTKPVSSISVKVVTAADFTRKLATRPGAEAPGTPWIITSHDTDSCTAWVSTKAPNVVRAETEAFRACRTAIDRAVDAAHAAAERSPKIAPSAPKL